MQAIAPSCATVCPSSTSLPPKKLPQPVQHWGWMYMSEPLNSSSHWHCESGLCSCWGRSKSRSVLGRQLGQCRNGQQAGVMSERAAVGSQLSQHAVAGGGVRTPPPLPAPPLSSHLAVAEQVAGFATICRGRSLHRCVRPRVCRYQARHRWGTNATAAVVAGRHAVLPLFPPIRRKQKALGLCGLAAAAATLT